MADIVWQPGHDRGCALKRSEHSRRAASHEDPLVHSHPRRQPLPRHSHGARAADFAYFKQVAVAADSLGYEGVLLPTGRSCEDPWVLAASLIDATRRLKFLVALRPGLVQPAQSARMAATFDRLSGGRLLVNLVTGGDPDELEGDGLFLDHAARYALSREFLTIWRELLARSHDGAALDFEGKHLQVKGGKLLYPPLQRPYPPLFFGGSSPEAHELAAEQLDTYLTWGEPPAAVADKVADIRARAARHGRTLEFGIRLHVIVRETEDEAWTRRAPSWCRTSTTATVAAAQKKFAQMDSVGQRRMAALHKGRFDKRQRARRASRWRRTCGPASAWCAAAPAPRWSATPSRWPQRISEYADARARVLHPVGLPAPGRGATASPSWCSRCCRSSCASAWRGSAR